MVAFLKAGGGVLIAGQAWHWASTKPKENTLLQFPGNKVSAVAGIYFSIGKVEILPVYPQIPSSWMTLQNGKDFEDDLEFLLTGVSEFDLQGSAVSSEILVHGSLAFPIGTTKDGQTFLAGSYYGQGRVIVVSHEGFLRRQTLAPFWKNAIHWLDGGRQGVVGVASKRALGLLSKSGLKCEKTEFKEGLSVFVGPAHSDTHAKEIREFVAEGGGLLIGGHAWNWAQIHPGQNELTHFPGNKILNQMGLSLLRGTITGGLHKTPEPKDIYHFRHLLHRFAGHVAHGEKLSKHEEENLKRLGRDCSIFLHMNATECSSYTQVVSSLTDIVMKSGMSQVCDSCPVKTPKDHLLLSVATEIYKVCPNPDALLPYLFKDNPLMPVVYDQKIKIDVNTAAEEWISTGLYLSPGMKTYIAMPEEMVNKGWKIQIGCQTDRLKARVIKRASWVCERILITAQMMQVCNLWGGLIYLLAPRKTQVEGLEVTVQMAVPAPYYKSGVTTQADWSLLRTAPSPWAELEFENIILTAHPKMTLGKRNNRAKNYVKRGKKLRSWSMWVALETYMQLQDKFGWDAFKKVFAAYFKISSPKDNDAKMNLYAVTFSQTVEMNLSAFFKSWGWPINAATEEKLSTLPPWSDHPMVQYG
ncbi:hypothetical protein F7725_020919 [Dissostichus mawsoni]|uniref:Peptidase M60 domain-containing protein n=1 Tax=Dissostichus mawsoni TaxID=36200 RepID=A0A7J5YFU7_DISMA|nr:hypothetical protein F7725_020919 [Dissostichus mawsoni]